MARRKRKQKAVDESCNRWAMVLNPENGEMEPSRTYQDLLASIGDRNFVNYIYAKARVPEIRDAMDKAGYKKNKQGEHTAKSIKMYFNLYKMLREKMSNETEMVENGFKDSDGSYVKFSSGSEAIEKAMKYNQDHDFKVANVNQIGSNFIVTIEDKNSKTIDKLLNLSGVYEYWKALEKSLEKLGIHIKDIEKINTETINPLTIKQIIKDWERFSKRDPQNFGKQSMRTLLELTKNTPLVQQALKKYGEDLDALAERVLKAFNDKSSTPEGEYSFLLNIIDNSKKAIEGMKLTDIRKNAEVLSDFSSSSLINDDVETQRILDELQGRFHIDSMTVLRTNNEVKSLSDAALEILQNINRQIANLKNLPKDKVTPYTQQHIANLQKTAELLGKEYKSRSYYTGLTVALSQVAEYTKTMDKVVASLKDPVEGSFLEVMTIKADKLMKIKNIHDGYMEVVTSLSTMDTVAVDEFVSEKELEKLKELASKIRDTLVNYNKIFTAQAKMLVMQVAFEYIGSDAKYDGQSITEMIDSAEDVAVWNFLFSVARNKNKLVSVFAGIVRDMQRERSRELIEYEREINRATQKLYKSDRKVKNTSFVYEKVGEDASGNFRYEAIASPYDWDSYDKARSKYYWTRKNDGVSDVELENEMEEYDRDNTKKIMMYGYEVTVPIDAFLKPNDFQKGWSDAQKDYYNSMMKLKVKLHSMMPSYVGHVYLAPQIRKNSQQFTNEWLERKITFKQYILGLLHNINAFKIKPDDTRFSKNGLSINEIDVNGQPYAILNTTFNNEKIRTVPMFYVKGLPDSYELLHDFSEATLKLATQALNYSKLTKIQNLVEIMADLLRNIPTNAKSANRRVADKVYEDSDTTVLKNAVKYGKQTRTARIIESYLQAQMYGRAEDPSKFSAFTGMLLKTTALKALTINTLGAANNWLVGELQNIIEACTGEFFNLWDYTQANIQLFTKMGIIDALTDNVNSKAGLLQRRFDPIQDYYRDMQDKKYFRTFLGRVFGRVNPYGMYQVGEYMIHMKNMYAMLNHSKVLYRGKKVSLMKVLKVQNKIDGNSELYIEDGVTTLDGRLLASLDDEFFNGLQRKIEYVNSRCHGAMNVEDKGVISYNDIGRLAMSFRQWMIGHYSKRFRVLYWDSSHRDPDMQNFYYDNKVFIDGKKHPLYDAFKKVYNEDPNDPTFKLELRDDVEIKDKDGITVNKEYVDAIFYSYLNEIGYREGFNATMLKFLTSTTSTVVEEYRKHVSAMNRLTVAEAAKKTKSEMTSAQLYNFKRFWASVGMFLFTWGFKMIIGDPDEEDDRLSRWWKYEMMRLFMEEKASSPTGVITESNKIINTPLPVLSVIYGFMYPVIGLIDGDLDKEVQKGRRKGQNKYWATIKRRTFPFSWIGNIEDIIYDIREGIDEDRFKVGQRNYKNY